MTDIAAQPVPRRRRRLSSCLTLVTALALAPAWTLGGADGAAAQPTNTQLAAGLSNGVLSVSGRGFGHGRGMSQWGAYGAADAGLSWAKILDFYYPGTVRSTLGTSDIRVWLSADTDGDTQVRPDPGLRVSIGNSTRTLPTGSAYAMWRAVPVNTAVQLQYRGSTGGWKSYPVGSGPSIRFATNSGVVRVLMPGGSTKHVRGTVSAVADSAATGRVRTVLNSTMDSYLRSVVPNEMPSSWHPQAVAAQSVAARTYAASYRERQRRRGANWDICDTVTCQVFKGVANVSASGVRSSGEDARASAAIAATDGTVLRTSGSPSAPYVLAEFSASNGGYTVAGPPVYQVAKADPYDGRMKNTNSSWQVGVSAAALNKAFPTVGSVRSVNVTKRDGNGAWGGRALEVTITGSRGVVRVSGATMRARLGLRSDWFTVGVTPASTPTPAPSPSPTPSPGGGSASTDALSAALVYTDSAGVLWRRPATATGWGPAVQIGRHWHTMDTLLAVGQWDGSGGHDLIARQSSTGRLLLYRGNGAGGLRGPVVLTGNVAHLRSLSAAGDMNGDGFADVVAADSRRANIVLLAGSATGRVTATTTLASAKNVAWVRGLGDVTKDGKADIMWSDSSGRAYIGVGNGTGGIARTITLGRGWTAFSDVWSAPDRTGDGVNDLFALRPDGAVMMYPSTGSGSFSAPRSFMTGFKPRLIAR